MLSSGRKNFGKFAGSSAGLEAASVGWFFVICYLSTLGRNLTSQQPGASPSRYYWGLYVLILTQPSVTVGMIKTFYSSGQLVNEKKTQVILETRSAKSIIMGN